MKTIEESMLKRVRGRGRGSAVTSTDFLDLGKRAAVDQGLSRLVRKNLLMRVSRGLYALPEINEWIGEVSPAPDEVAKLRERLQPAERRQLVKDIPLAPAWMAPVFRKIAGEGSGTGE